MEDWSYEHLVRAVQNDMFSLVGECKYIFVKLPINDVPSTIFEVFYKLQLRGYIPIVREVERNKIFRHNPTLLYKIVVRGALAQIGASSLTGINGHVHRKFALKLCKHNLVHLISIDTTKIEESFNTLQSAYKYLQKKTSARHANYFRTNAKLIGGNTDFHILSPIKFKK